VIIGWSKDRDHLDPKTFIENNKFVDFLTTVLKENIHKVEDSNLKAMADWQKDGYDIYIYIWSSWIKKYLFMH
jgi:hypothetical protein